MTRKKLSAAEREARSEQQYLRDRPAREAKRRELTAATWRQLEQTARVAASVAARTASMCDQVVLDKAKRRRMRIAQRHALWRDYKAWLAACPPWLKELK